VLHSKWTNSIQTKALNGGGVKQTITIECASMKEAKYVLESAFKAQGYFRAFHGSHWTKKGLKKIADMKGKRALRLGTIKDAGIRWDGTNLGCGGR